MSIREQIVTPEVASDLLNKNVNNRKLQEKRVTFLADAMARGEWKYNGDTIRISKTGRLLDGQHRLRAIEKSGIAQKYILVDDLDDDSFTTIDIGSIRKTSQMLGMLGSKNVTTLAAASKMHLLYKTVGRPIHGTPEKQPTHSQIVDFAEENVMLHKSASFANNKWNQKYIGPSTCAFCHYEFSLVDPVAANSFFEELEIGEFSYKNSPLRFLRDLLIEERGANYSPDKSRRMASIFKAFRLYRQRKEAKIIRLEKDQGEWFKL